jgi:hypothetical protein
MEEQLISFEVAKLAKEKGFNVAVCSCYTKDGNFQDLNDLYNCSCEGGMQLKECYNDYNTHPRLFSAPTQSLLQKWLRDVYNTIINLSAIPDHRDIDNKKLSFYYDILKDNDWIEEELDEKNSDPVYYATYEEALESGLEAALNLITKK